MPPPVEHPILDRIYRQLIRTKGIHECLAEPISRDIVQGSESIVFTNKGGDWEGDWEIVVRQIEGGRD